MILHSSSFLIISFACLLMTIVVLGQGKEIAIKQKQWNFCHWIKCENGGTCRTRWESPAAYQCQCPFGYNGVLCENKLNLSICVQNPCLNKGNCTITKYGLVQCQCLTNYTGVYCENLVIE